VWGRVSLYEPRTEVSLVVSFFLPAGEGREALRLKALKEKLLKMGLFDEERKRKLPAIVEHLGVVTAAGGAAIRDIIRVGRDRYPRLKITLFPALVQGAGAEDTIVRGVEALGATPGIEAIIVGRGGGSKEDLGAFNGERLALAVAACPVPVVAAVGHEIDRTVLDLVASYSVSTPSAAAALCATPAEELLGRAAALADDMAAATEHSLRDRQLRLDRALLSLPRPAEWIQRTLTRLSATAATIEKKALSLLRRDERRLSAAALLLERHNPVSPLEKGFVVVRQRGRMVKRRTGFDAATSFSLRFADGEAAVTPSEDDDR